MIQPIKDEIFIPDTVIGYNESLYFTIDDFYFRIGFPGFKAVHNLMFIAYNDSYYVFDFGEFGLFRTIVSTNEFVAYQFEFCCQPKLVEDYSPSLRQALADNDCP